MKCNILFDEKSLFFLFLKSGCPSLKAFLFHGAFMKSSIIFRTSCKIMPLSQLQKSVTFALAHEGLIALRAIAALAGEFCPVSKVRLDF